MSIWLVCADIKLKSIFKLNAHSPKIVDIYATLIIQFLKDCAWYIMT